MWQVPLLLSLTAGAFTGVGGVLAVLGIGESEHAGDQRTRLALWEAAAAGFMLCIALYELVPEALATPSLTAPLCAVYFLAGAAVFWIIKTVTPDADVMLTDALDLDSPTAKASLDKRRVLAKGIYTSIAIFLHNLRTWPARVCGRGGACAGVGARVPCAGMCAQVPCAGVGARVPCAGDALLGMCACIRVRAVCVRVSTAEGVAVYAASHKGLELGIPLAISIGIHNIPEGFAVALHVFYATRCKTKAVVLALLSGMGEPLAVLLALLFFKAPPSEVRARPRRESVWCIGVCACVWCVV
jgi:hypothetical protein